MQNKLLIALSVVLVVGNLSAKVTFAQESSHCALGKTLKVATVQAGSYSDFQKVFLQTALALSKDGLIRSDLSPLTPDFNFDVGDNYLKFAKSTKGGCFEFLEDGFYDGKWDLKLIKQNTEALKKRIKEKGDVDLVWALGTVAGQDFADPSLNIPVMVMTCTDPENSGIIGPGEFSDKKNIHVQKEVDRYKSELQMFYDIFKFKNLGVIFDDNEENLLGQAYPIVKDLSRQLGFNLKICQGPVIDDDKEKAQLAFSKCAKELAKVSDAVYLPMGNGASDSDLFTQIKPLLDKEIPTFSQTGSKEVEMGVLLSLSNNNLEQSGIFEAEVAKKIYQGIAPEKISQYYYAPLSLSLNLQTALLIEWKPSFEVLIAVDQVFQNIKRPDLKYSEQAKLATLSQNSDLKVKLQTVSN